MEDYVYKNQKKLRRGFTTGSCAAAAAKAAAYVLLFGKEITEVRIVTPKKEELLLAVEKLEQSGEGVSCCIRKDSGDDPDITNGMEVFARVSFCLKPHKEQVLIVGGQGIGTVTKPGLDQPVGEAAINRVPRQMIQLAVLEVIEEAGFSGTLQVMIYAPQGEELAQKTFNPRLGIEGGISILGTSGIVEPMSEQALVDTIQTELSQRSAEGKKNLLITPGNYGHRYAVEVLKLPAKADVSCSNFIGETLDLAAGFGFEKVLLVGNAGKLIKLAAGIFQTHSKIADGRMEIISAHAALQGADSALVHKLMECVMTDAAFALLEEAGLLEDTIKSVVAAIEQHLRRRSGAQMQTEVILFSEKRGLLGQTANAAAFAQLVREGE